MSTLTIVGPAGVALAPTDAAAHIQLIAPTQRTAAQKTGPCGQAGSTRGDAVSVFAPGDRITVMWDETIDHPGHFRISFDAEGDDDFVDPAAFDDFDSAPSVMLDNIPDTPGGGVSGVTITLPDIECDACTLQVIQMMTYKPPYGDGNDIYYQCADITLSADAPLIDAGPGGEPDAGVRPPPISGGCHAGGGDVGWAIVLALAALIWQLRRAGRLRAAPQRPPRTRRRQR